MRHAKRTDVNQSSIVSDLRDEGIQVILTSSMGQDFPDILVCHIDWVLIEIKTLDGGLDRGQLSFISNAQGFIGIATDYSSARLLAKWPNDYAITPKQKDLIAIWLLRNPAQKTLAVRAFFKVIKV